MLGILDLFLFILSYIVYINYIFWVVATYILYRSILLTFTVIIVLFIFSYLLSYMVYLVFEFPKFILTYQVNDLMKSIDAFISSVIINDNLPEEKIVSNISKNKNEVSFNTLHLWIYKLKSYRLRLITIVPICSLALLALLSLSYTELVDIGIVKQIVTFFQEEILLLNRRQFIGFVTKYFPLAWIIIVYQDEVHEVGIRINKLELINNIRKENDVNV